MNKKKENRLLCPECGTEFGIVERAVTTGATAPVRKKAPAGPSMTALERIEALRAVGVDVSHLFAMQGSGGGEYIASNRDGRLAILDEDDPVFNYIKEQGDVPNRRLFRRWIMAQMFHMMSYVPFGRTRPAGVTEMIHRLGYEYQWKMLLNELLAQMKMEKRDPENFADRNRWFNAGVAAAMAEDYLTQLKIHVDAMPEKSCKGIPYKRVAGHDIFVEDLERKLYGPLRMALLNIRRAKSASRLYNATRNFCNMRTRMAYDTPQSKVWMDAYKGAGAFYTIQNLVRFHGCTLLDDNGKRLDKYQSLTLLSLKAEMYKNGEGWRLLALLKKTLEDNSIDIQKKMEQWRKKK